MQLKLIKTKMRFPFFQLSIFKNILLLAVGLQILLTFFSPFSNNILLHAQSNNITQNQQNAAQNNQSSSQESIDPLKNLIESTCKIIIEEQSNQSRQVKRKVSCEQIQESGNCPDGFGYAAIDGKNYCVSERDASNDILSDIQQKINEANGNQSDKGSATADFGSLETGQFSGVGSGTCDTEIVDIKWWNLGSPWEFIPIIPENCAEIGDGKIRALSPALIPDIAVRVWGFMLSLSFYAIIPFLMYGGIRYMWSGFGGGDPGDAIAYLRGGFMALFAAAFFYIGVMVIVSLLDVPLENTNVRNLFG